jgi:uncharacterized protein (DUF433 family)
MNVQDYCGRISEDVFKTLNSLDDLIEIIELRKSGCNFKEILKNYKEYLNKDLPQFTMEELLKIDKYYSELRKMYDWYDSYDLLTAIEYEVRTKEN